MRRGALFAALAISASAASVVWATEQFLVFFAKNDCSITAEAYSVIAEYAGLAKQANLHRIVVEGNAGKDEGSKQQIMQLSRCRGEAIRAILVKEGIDANDISVIGKGDSNPLSVHFNGDLRMDRWAIIYETD